MNPQTPADSEKRSIRERIEEAAEKNYQERVWPVTFKTAFEQGAYAMASLLIDELRNGDYDYYGEISMIADALESRLKSQPSGEEREE